MYSKLLHAQDFPVKLFFFKKKMCESHTSAYFLLLFSLSISASQTERRKGKGKGKKGGIEINARKEGKKKAQKNISSDLTKAP